MCVCARVYVCVFCDCELVSLIFSFSLSVSQSFVSLFFVNECEDFCVFYCQFGVLISPIVGAGAENLFVIRRFLGAMVGNHGGIDLLNLSLRGG